MMPVDVSATERAAPLTETLPVRRPVDESISNSPMLDLPASIHIEPFGCGCVADDEAPGCPQDALRHHADRGRAVRFCRVAVS